MSQIISLISEFGDLTVVAATVSYILLYGEFRFPYPRRRR